MLDENKIVFLLMPTCVIAFKIYCLQSHLYLFQCTFWKIPYLFSFFFMPQHRAKLDTQEMHLMMIISLPFQRMANLSR